MKKIFSLLVILFLANAIASAQFRKFQFEDEICVYYGTYNARRFSTKQLDGAYRLWFTRDFEMDVYKVRANYWGAVEKLPTVSEIDEEYRRKSAALRALAVVNTAFWKNLKAKKLEVLEKDYQLMRATAQAYRKPKALHEVTFADACVKRFSPPLTAGGDVLLKFWREIVEERFKKGQMAESERKYFEANFASEERFHDALLDIIGYEWWTCVYPRINRDADDSVARENFRKLFKRVEQGGCDYA